MNIFKRARKKTWEEKTKAISNCFYRSYESPVFASQFYKHLLFLNPKIKEYFKDTDWKHQNKALMHALNHLIGFLENPDDSFHKSQITRIAKTHSKQNINIHPHNYYYWIDALILTLKDLDPQWHKNLEYYLRECLFLPISFIISLYHKDEA